MLHKKRFAATFRKFNPYLCMIGSAARLNPTLRRRATALSSMSSPMLTFFFLPVSVLWLQEWGHTVHFRMFLMTVNVPLLPFGVWHDKWWRLRYQKPWWTCMVRILSGALCGTPGWTSSEELRPCDKVVLGVDHQFDDEEPLLSGTPINTVRPCLISTWRSVWSCKMGVFLLWQQDTIPTQSSQTHFGVIDCVLSSNEEPFMGSQVHQMRFNYASLVYV